jgi:uncharacterized protein (DUF58 family)
MRQQRAGLDDLTGAEVTEQMENPRRYLDPQVLAQIQGLDLRARLVVEGFLSGVHPSPYHGFSVEFAEHREYVPGDDIRHIDWKVYARTQRYFLKQHEDETDVACWLLLDVSESMSYGSGPLTKYDLAAVTAASVAHLVLRQRDRVGLVTFDDRIREIVWPSGRHSNIDAIIRALDHGVRGGTTRLGAMLHEIAERLDRRGLVILISDLLDDVGEVQSGLRRLRHDRQEAILFHVLDAAELDFPFEKPVMFCGMEGLQDLATDPLSLRGSYLSKMSVFLTNAEQGCREQQIDYAQLRTDAPLGEALSRYLAHRPRRQKARSATPRSGGTSASCNDVSAGESPCA